MKKQLVLSLFFACMIVLNTDAQDYSKYRFGLQASPLLGWISPDVADYESDGIRMGFSWGGVMEYYFAKNYAIKTGFNLTNIGGKLKYNDKWLDKSGVSQGIGTLSRTYQLKYFEIPVSIKFRTNEIGYMTYFGHIGISTNLLTSAKADDRFSLPLNTNVMIWEKRDIQSDVLFIREALVVGLGVEYGITASTKLVSSLTYNNGFTDILRGKNVNGTAHRAFQNYIELNLGIIF